MHLPGATSTRRSRAFGWKADWLLVLNCQMSAVKLCTAKTNDTDPSSFPKNPRTLCLLGFFVLQVPVGFSLPASHDSSHEFAYWVTNPALALRHFVGATVQIDSGYLRSPCALTLPPSSAKPKCIDASIGRQRPWPFYSTYL